MKKILFLGLLASQVSFAQSIAQKLDTQVKKLMATSLGKVSNLSFYVADEKGNKVYEYNSEIGLSTASTQKIFTAAAILDALGTDYKYSTNVAFSGEIINDALKGELWITSNGDPSLGSWRYENKKPEDFRKQLIQAIKNKGIKSITGDLIIDDSYFDFQNIPGGWAWNDIGNYYGAGVWGVNWKENQFDIAMKGNKIKSFSSNLPNLKWVNDIKAIGKSDESIIYTAPNSQVGYLQGNLPARDIKISGAMPNPPLTLGEEIKSWLKEEHINLQGNVTSISQMRINGEVTNKFPSNNIFFTYNSPALKEMVYWFLRKSINFYGETFLKTLAKEKMKSGSFKDGITYMKNFWKDKGINVYSINFADGSGLSPQNYVSAKAEVQALLWAKKQDWFPSYFEAFPTQNNAMKMKSGTMKDVKSFAGYHNGYVFSIIINNYQANAVIPLFNILQPLK